MPDRIDLATLDDHRDPAQRAVAVLAGGATVGMTVDGLPALLALATRPTALATLASATSAASLLLFDPDAWADWVEPPPAAPHRLARRAWPGPVRLVARPAEAGLFNRLAPDVRALLQDRGGQVAFQVPSDPVVRTILGLAAGPVLLIETPDAAWARPEAVEEQHERDQDPGGPALILDSGPPDPSRRATVVRLDGEGWAVTRPGVVPEPTVQEMAGTILLFVCTGNTCRSPMAAATCRALLAQRLGCAVADLPARGFTVESAGVGASPGGLASAHAVTILRETSTRLGLDPDKAGLGRHRSQPVTPHLVHRADRIFTMTWDHLDALLDRFPEVADRVRLLDPSGDDIPDPYGSNEATYRATAQVIDRHLQGLLHDLGIPPRPVSP